MGKMQFLIFLGYSFSEITILQKANPINNNSAVIRLIISKSTHHPTNKSLFNLPRGINLEAILIYPIPTFLQRGGNEKLHECGAILIMKIFYYSDANMISISISSRINLSPKFSKYFPERNRTSYFDLSKDKIA